MVSIFIFRLTENSGLFDLLDSGTACVRHLIIPCTIVSIISVHYGQNESYCVVLKVAPSYAHLICCLTWNKLRALPELTGIQGIQPRPAGIIGKGDAYQKSLRNHCVPVLGYMNYAAGSMMLIIASSL